MNHGSALEGGAIARLDRIGGSGFVIEMIELFLENGPERLDSAREAYDRKDPATLYRAVHSLKSTAANLGARTLQATAESAEARARDEDMDAIPPLLEDLEREYERAREALEAERDRLESAGPTEERK